jgi:hypothetical protein
MPLIMKQSLITLVTTVSLLGTFPLSIPPLITQAQESVSFSDISDHRYEAEITEAAQRGYVQGFPDNTFRPDQPLSREEAISLIVDATSTMLPIQIDEEASRKLNTFADVDSSRWSAAKINWAQDNFPGLSIDRLSSNFRPEDDVTRAELIRFLRSGARYLNVGMTGKAALSATQDPIEFSDVAGPDIQLTREMSAFCGVASALNEEGDQFAPMQAASRAYSAAAILRTIQCVEGGG